MKGKVLIPALMLIQVPTSQREKFLYFIFSTSSCNVLSLIEQGVDLERGRNYKSI